MCHCPQKGFRISFIRPSATVWQLREPNRYAFHMWKWSISHMSLHTYRNISNSAIMDMCTQHDRPETVHQTAGLINAIWPLSIVGLVSKVTPHPNGYRWQIFPRIYRSLENPSLEDSCKCADVGGGKERVRSPSRSDVRWCPECTKQLPINVQLDCLRRPSPTSTRASALNERQYLHIASNIFLRASFLQECVVAAGWWASSYSAYISSQAARIFDNDVSRLKCSCCYGPIAAKSPLNLCVRVGWKYLFI